MNRGKFLRDMALAAGAIFMEPELSPKPVVDKPKLEEVRPSNLEGKPTPSIGINREKLIELAKNAKVVVFGESHHPDSTIDRQRFNMLLPVLKEVGYDSVALEVLARAQKNVDDFIIEYDRAKNSADKEVAFQKLVKGLPYESYSNEELALIIRTAADNGLLVRCIDLRNREDPYYQADLSRKRDTHMADQISTLIEGDHKVAAYVGAAHAETDETAEFGLVYNGDENVTKMVTINPLAHRLREKYGTSIVAIDLTGENNSGVPYHFTE